MKLSVITINYNNAIGLEKTITRVINQTYSDYEYIVIDGGSSDGSVDILEKYSDKIDYWVSEPDSGIYNAMNKGIKQATGDYILFSNSGDVLYDENTLSKVFEKPMDCDFIYGDMERVYTDGHKDVVTMPEKVNIYTLLYSSVHHPASFTKKELFHKYGFYREDLKIVADWAFFLNLVAFTNATSRYIPIKMASFSMDGISSNEKLLNEERQKVIKETFSPELLHILDFYHTYYIYDRFYNKRIFVTIRRVLDFFRGNKQS